MADKQALVDQFIGVTGIDNDRARFHLESAAWNLELALASFYEDGDVGPQVEEVQEEEVVAEDPRGSGGAKPQSGTKKQSGSSRFATLSSMRQDDDSDDSNEGQAFYAGGSERSGQQVLGPPRKKANPDEMVDTLFKSAKEHGAEVVESGEQKKKKGPTFRGTGYRLGDTEEASDVIPGARAEAPRQVDIVLKLWKSGFSVDNGPQRDYNDPANKEFLDSISKGEVPRELIRSARGGEVNLNMEDHRNEDFVPPKVPVKAFEGAGHMLGSPTPNVTKLAGAGASASPALKMSVDESKPTTSLQIRLADGTRLVAKFNHTHCISDVRNFIISSRPQYAGSNFVLMTTFPNKELCDETLTLEDAKLLNAVIVQRQK